jgi:hypothetical protein
MFALVVPKALRQGCKLPGRAVETIHDRYDLVGILADLVGRHRVADMDTIMAH